MKKNPVGRPTVEEKKKGYMVYLHKSKVDKYKINPNREINKVVNRIVDEHENKGEVE